MQKYKWVSLSLKDNLFDIKNDGLEDRTHRNDFVSEITSFSLL